MIDNVVSATITLYKINEVALYQSELISSNGTFFYPYDTSTILSFHIYKDFEDITNQFNDIEWRRFSCEYSDLIEDENWGTEFSGLSSIYFHKEQINKKCLIQVDAYTVINGKRTCVASSRITLIDVNDLYANDEPPENPIDGAMWVDTSKKPLIIYSWNKKTNQWIRVGKTTPFVRNVLRNSNFWRLNNEYWIEENRSYLLNLSVVTNDSKKWLRLKSNKATVVDSTAGIVQITEYPIEKSSSYTLSFLAYKINDTIYRGNSIYIKIVSISESNESTELLTTMQTLEDEIVTQITQTFSTLNNTEKIKIIIGVEPEKMCEFYVTEFSLYNTDSYYPWELAPEDVQLQFDNKLNSDHLSVFNALTKNGTMEGMYIDVDEGGIEHYYFNANHIKTGSLDGGLINGIGLNITDDVTGESIFHVYKDENGTHIDMIANNLYIGEKPASTIEYVNNSIIASEQNTYTHIETSIYTSESNTKTYVDENIVTTLESAAEYTSSTINTSEINTKNYVDKTISAAKKESNIYTDTSVLASAESLMEFIETTHTDIENSAHEHTNESITELKEYVDTQDNALSTSINTKTSEAIQSCNTYTDNKIADCNIQLATINQTLSNKVDSMKIINTINNSTETELIDITKIDLTDITYDINIPEEKSYVRSNYSSDGIVFTTVSAAPTTIDTVLDSITCTITDMNISLDLSSLDTTNYIDKSDDNSIIYMNNNAIIKLLIYEIKKLKDQIAELNP